jgi:hypothetical protein
MNCTVILDAGIKKALSEKRPLAAVVRVTKRPVDIVLVNEMAGSNFTVLQW